MIEIPNHHMKIPKTKVQNDKAIQHKSLSFINKLKSVDHLVANVKKIFHNFHFALVPQMDSRHRK